MDSYPGDLLAGVFPLVFAVNSILPEKKSSDSSDGGESIKNDLVAPSNDQSSNNIMQDQPPPPPPPPPKTRSLFDRFLDAMAASLADEDDDSPPLTSPKSETLKSFLSQHDKSFLSQRDTDSSSDDDNSLASGGSSKKRRAFAMASPNSFRVTHTRLGVLRGSIRSNQVDTPLSTAYARALMLMDGPQGFFQRARIISVSTKHGLPPSKDPDGTNNRIVQHSQARNNMAFGATGPNANKLSKASPLPKIDGILPAGWLEKHVHALPSVLLVVTSYDASASRKEQDQHVCETVQHLRYSLAPKRECRIQLVCLVSPNVSVLDVDDWVSEICKTCHLNVSCVTVLDTAVDLQGAPGMTTSPPTRKLLKTVREASLAYYLGQARRSKHKYGSLGHEQQPSLLPLAVRYCFKIGIFYEFLLRHEKSTKYLTQAYRHLELYYRHFVLSRAPLPVVVNPQENEQEKEGGVEVTLAGSPPKDIATEEETREGSSAKNDPPSDMAHQCRAIADWLNLKLLQAGFLSAAFSSSENGGLVAAASQWRRHSMVFLSNADKTNPSWNHWAYVVHQRLVMAQLVERRPPRESSLASSLKGAAKDEVLLRCSAWRNYEAAAEAMLRLGFEVERANSNHVVRQTTEPVSDDMRPPFVGGIDSEGLEPKFREECKRNHKEFALDTVLHAVSIFENELNKDENKIPKEQEDEFTAMLPKQKSRAGARLYYLAGGILLGIKRYEEATAHLEKAVRYATGWKELEMAIRRLLIECYEKHPPVETREEQRENVTSMILDSYFNARMSSPNLRRALDNFATLTGTNTLKWKRECTDESDSSMPFSFTVTFPNSTHATAGDIVAASVVIQSNLDYAVHINSITLLSMAGRILIPSSDMLCAKNANDGSGGGIIVQANSAIYVSTMIGVPKDVDSITSDKSGNGGEKEGTAGKGSFAKSARPRAGGLTSAGGARLIDERTLDDNRRERNAQWSLRYLGGKPLRCDGISLVFYPLHAEKVASRVNLVELVIMHKKPKTQAPIKRTPFEENNYVSSAWSRPHDLPLLLGPRCLRVLGPMAQMVVTNLTNPLTNGTAIEGTVNRILLRLQAGQKEECHDIKYKIVCSSTSLSVDGSTTHLDGEEDQGASDGTKKDSRVPVMVLNDLRPSSTHSPEYKLPPGWEIVGSGQGTSNEVMPEVSSLGAGESTYIFLDLYRPPAPPAPTTGGGDNDLCQTDYDIAITYRQSRPSGQRQGRQRNHRAGHSDEEESDLSDLVFLEYSGSVLWNPPVLAEFSAARERQTAFPSGSSHPSNICSVENAEDSETGENEPHVASAQSPEISVVDGERVSARCVLSTNASSNGLAAEVERIYFENRDEVCRLHLISDCKGNVIYSQGPHNLCCVLEAGSKFTFSFTVETKFTSGNEKSNVSSSLGVVCVDWKPIAVPLPEGVPRVEGKLISHGPIALKNSSTIKFRGPQFCIESAPFEATLDSLPPAPRLAIPFEVSYRIINKTDLHQKLTVAMSESPMEGDGDDMSEGFLLSGLVSGEITLAPKETQVLSYTALATRAGKMVVPAISVSSSRHSTWVVNNDPTNRVHVFVQP